MGGCGSRTGPSRKFSLPLPEGISLEFALSALNVIDEYHGSRGTGVEGYKPFGVLDSGAINDGTVRIQCSFGDEEYLRNFLPDYLSKSLQRVEARMAKEMDI